MANDPRNDENRSCNPEDESGRPRKRRSRHRFTSASMHTASAAAFNQRQTAARNESDFTDRPISNAQYEGSDTFYAIRDDVVNSELLQNSADAVAGEEVSDGGDITNICTNNLNWRVIWGLIMTNGSLKLTKEQYQSMRLIADTFRKLPSYIASDEDDFTELELRRVDCLPHYTTLFKKYKPMLFWTLSVRSCSWLTEIDMRKAGARCTESHEGAVPLIPIVTVLPSEYAREDVACGPVFELMKSTSLGSGSSAVPTISATGCVDLWPFVAAREWFYGPRTSLSVDCISPHS